MNINPALMALLLTATCAPGLAQTNNSQCDLRHGFGPFDYRPDKQRPSEERMSYTEKLNLVQGAHFTPRVENLIGAQSGGQIGPPGADIDYTLRAFPNNHRALIAVIRYGEKYKSETPPALRVSVECYLANAMRFAPDDTIVRIIYSSYLGKHNRETEAADQLNIATNLAESGFTHYNIGLAYFDMKRYELALASAHRALAMGFDRELLKEKLKSVGSWSDYVPSVANDAASAAPSDAKH